MSRYDHININPGDILTYKSPGICEYTVRAIEYVKGNMSFTAEVIEVIKHVDEIKVGHIATTFCADAFVPAENYLARQFEYALIQLETKLHEG